MRHPCIQVVAACASGLCSCKTEEPNKLRTANSSSKFPFRSQEYYSCELAEQTALLSQLNEAKDCVKKFNETKGSQTGRDCCAAGSYQQRAYITDMSQWVLFLTICRFGDHKVEL